MPTRNEAPEVDQPKFDCGTIVVACPACQAMVAVEAGEQFSGALIDCERCRLPFYLAPKPSDNPEQVPWHLIVPVCDDLAYHGACNG